MTKEMDGRHAGARPFCFGTHGFRIWIEENDQFTFNPSSSTMRFSSAIWRMAYA